MAGKVAILLGKFYDLFDLFPYVRYLSVKLYIIQFQV